jgi:hypothetical protein
MSDVVDSGREIGLGNIDTIDPKLTPRGASGISYIAHGTFVANAGISLVCALALSPFRDMSTVRHWIGRLVLVASVAGAGLARAENGYDKIDTEYLFGFVTGTDVGEVGEKELENTTVGRFGKRTGSYGAISHTLALEYVPVENLRLEMGAIAGYHAISGVSDLDNLRRASFQGLSLEIRYRLLARERAAFGLTLLAEPHWARIDETSGQPANQYGTDLAVLIDKELIPNRVVAAFNVFYAPEATQSRVMGAWSHDATFGVGAGLMVQVWPGFFMGGEARYLRAYESLGLDAFAGHALFVGPNLFFKPAERWRVTATWAVQVAGKAVDVPGSLDLTNFERHQVRLRIGYEF